jgi:hypothetical protein
MRDYHCDYSTIIYFFASNADLQAWASANHCPAMGSAVMGQNWLATQVTSAERVSALIALGGSIAC